MTSVRDRIAAFSRGAIHRAREEEDARDGTRSRAVDDDAPTTATTPTTTTTTTTTTRDESREDAFARASTREPTGGRAKDEEEMGWVDGNARATAFERASDALALARAVEATLRRERAFEDAARRAWVRVEAAERAYEAVARRRAPSGGDDAGGRGGDASARSSGLARADASTANVVRSFSFARAEEEGSDDDEVTTGARADEGDGSRSTDADADDADDADDAVRQIDAARREIARLLKRAAAMNASTRGRERSEKPSRRDRFELELSRDANLRRELARDRVVVLDSILAALDVDDE